jgi:hypothetical protein
MIHLSANTGYYDPIYFFMNNITRAHAAHSANVITLPLFGDAQKQEQNSARKGPLLWFKRKFLI